MEHNKREYQQIFGDMNKEIEITMVVVAALPILYDLINRIYNILYQHQCEVFYHLPGKYFQAQVTSKLIYLFCMLILIALLIIPICIKDTNGKSFFGFDFTLKFRVCFSLVLGLEFGIFNVQNYFELLEDISSTFSISNGLIVATTITIIILQAISMTGLVVLSATKKQGMSQKKVFVITLIATLISAGIFAYGTVKKLSSSVEQKTKYETVMIGDEKYFVLSHIDSKDLIVECEWNDDGTVSLDTEKYQFVEKEFGIIYQYTQLNHSPIIVNGAVK